jgi:hypothetical protein
MKEKFGFMIVEHNQGRTGSLNFGGPQKKKKKWCKNDIADLKKKRKKKVIK